MKIYQLESDPFIYFLAVGTSNDPCTDIYHGKSAFSEIEVKQVSEKLTELAHTVGLKSYWNIHAYSQLVLYPWSWTPKPAKDDFAIVSVYLRHSFMMKISRYKTCISNFIIYIIFYAFEITENNMLGRIFILIGQYLQLLHP